MIYIKLGDFDGIVEDYCGSRYDSDGVATVLEHWNDVCLAATGTAWC